MKLTLFLAAAVIIISSAACKKTGSGNLDCDLTMANIAGKYKWSSITIRKPDGSVVNMQECQKDDWIELRVDSTYNMWDLPNKCEPTTQRDGVWSVLNGKFVQDGYDYTVDYFDCNKITFHRENTPVAGYSVSFSAVKF